jgi:hypothetical protein
VSLIAPWLACTSSLRRVTSSSVKPFLSRPVGTPTAAASLSSAGDDSRESRPPPGTAGRPPPSPDAVVVDPSAAAPVEPRKNRPRSRASASASAAALGRRTSTALSRPMPASAVGGRLGLDLVLGDRPLFGGRPLLLLPFEEEEGVTAAVMVGSDRKRLMSAEYDSTTSGSETGTTGPLPPLMLPPQARIVRRWLIIDWPLSVAVARSPLARAALEAAREAAVEELSAKAGAAAAADDEDDTAAELVVERWSATARADEGPPKGPVVDRLAIVPRSRSGAAPLGLAPPTIVRPPSLPPPPPSSSSASPSKPAALLSRPLTRVPSWTSLARRISAEPVRLRMPRCGWGGGVAPTPGGTAARAEDEEADDDEGVPS